MKRILKNNDKQYQLLVRLVMKSKVKSIYFFLQSLTISVNVEFYVSFLNQFGIEK